MNTQELRVVLDTAGLTDVRIWQMDGVQQENMYNKLHDMISEVVEELHVMTQKGWDSEKAKECNSQLSLFNKAMEQLDWVIQGPEIEISSNGIEIMKIQMMETWDPEKEAFVNGRPTDEFEYHMRELVERNRETLEQCVSGDLAIVDWCVVGNTTCGASIIMDQGEVMVLRKDKMTANSLMVDYAMYVGNATVDTKDPVDPVVLTPMNYLEEFMENAWQPKREVALEFLGKFYKDTTVIEEFDERIAWDNEAYD